MHNSSKEKKLTIGLIVEDVFTEFAKDVISNAINAIPPNRNIEIVVIAGKFVDYDGPEDSQKRYKSVYNSIYRLEEICKFDGLIIALGSMAKIKRQIINRRFFKSLINTPKVFVAFEIEGMVNVVYDNEPGIKEAVDYLVNVCGLTKFGMLGGREDNLDSNRRKEIYKRCLENNRLKFDENCYEDTDMSINTLAEAERLLNRNPDLEAIFCVNDAVANGLYEAMKKRRLVPGKDIRVFGFDNTRKAGDMIPSLATIGAENVTLGQRALESILQMINGEKVESTYIPTRLYGRESCDYEMYEYTTLEMLNVDAQFINRMFDDCFYRYRYESVDENSVDLRRLFFEFTSKILNAMKNRYMSREEFSETEELIDIFFDKGAINYTDATKLLQSMEKLQGAINSLQRNPATCASINRLFACMRNRAILALSKRMITENDGFSADRVSLENFLTECTDFSKSSKDLIDSLVKKFDRLGLEDAAFFMFETPSVYESESAYLYPDEVSLRCYTKAGELYVLPEERQRCPIADIFKRDEINSKKRGFIAFPVTFKDYIYGILVCVLTKDIADKGEYIAGQLGRTIYISHTQESENTEREMLTYNSIAESLAAKYDIIYHVNSGNGEYSEYKTDEKNGKLIVTERGGNFFDDIRKESEYLLFPEDRSRVLEVLNSSSLIEILNNRRKYSIDYRKIIDNEVKNTRLTVLWSSDKVHFVIGVENIDAEIKKEEEHERELSSERELARKDQLTGVKNKNAYREFEENLQKKMNSKAKILPFAVVVCDINDLKKINDTLGHVAGDEHIKKACKMICEVFAHSPVYRVGGDEFVAVLSGDDFVNREKLLKKLRGKVLKNVNKPNGVVVASGISDYESMKDKSLSDVFERADARMYENKNFLKYI